MSTRYVQHISGQGERWLVVSETAHRWIVDYQEDEFANALNLPKSEYVLVMLPEEEAMKWMTDKPTKPGWYWWLNDYDYPPQIVWVRHTQDGDVYCIQIGGREIFPGNMGGEWAGPLVPPKETP